MRIARLAPTQPSLRFTFNGQVFYACAGDTVAAALYAAGVRAWRRTRRGSPRGLLCDMGVCCDCLVAVDGQPDLRACLIPVKEGMRVETNLAQEALA